ncbi:hypothetical protein JOE49_000024 [Paenibacillus sp. PvR133]|jgi:hypothetical protein|nr:hypothetical protein [Paenibacillus sp. PvR133]
MLKRAKRRLAAEQGFESGEAQAFAFAMGFYPLKGLYNPENPVATAIVRSNHSHSGGSPSKPIHLFP